jgi:hypothetical protein
MLLVVFLWAGLDFIRRNAKELHSWNRFMHVGLKGWHLHTFNCRYLQQSLLRIDKSPFWQLRKSKARFNTSSTSHREIQRRKDKTEYEGPRNENQKRTKHKIKHKSSMNNSASLTPVQGPSTLARMIVTSLSLLPHQLHQLPTVG